MNNNQKSDNRVIRVFISSTFRDMKEEREILVKRVFPQLRRLCEERGVTWGEVDLRWGVTEEQASEGKVLPICLEEIKRCRPYFIGILGERYGWVPDTISQDLIDHEPWLKTHLTHSVTELEILQGVLNDPNIAEHAFFYFRDPQYLNHLPKDVVSSDFISEDEESKTKLLRLKDRIEKSGFPLRKDYPDPIALSEFVLQDFTRIINTLYPPEENIDALSRDALDHEAYARSRAEIYIGRQEYFDALNAHAIGNGPPLVVLGESGSGKSALLSNWALQYQKELKKKSLATKEEGRKKLMFWQKNRSENENGDVPLIMHFVGASSGSVDWAAMLRRIMGELKRRFAIHQDIPDNSVELRAAFANWLHMASVKGRVVLILDAINQLEDREGALDLVWLPPDIPDKVRLILSTLPGRSLDELKKRNWPIINIQPFVTEEIGYFIEKYLAQYSKTLSPLRMERIANREQTANPLYIKVLLEELRLFGEHERLDERINYYLEAKNPNELYSKVLARWEEDYEDENGLVGNTMSLLWAARRGLTESEILELLGKKGDPLPRAKWSPLFLAARESLVSRMGLLNFSHDFLREAVKDRYISTGEQQKAAHIRLADYFEESELNPRKIEEFLWQFAKGQCWQRLYSQLADVPFFTKSWEANELDVKAFWTLLETNSFSKLSAYRKAVDSPESITDPLYRLVCIPYLVELFHSSGSSNEALKLNQFLIDRWRKGYSLGSRESLSNQALILTEKGRHEEAMTLLEEAELIDKKQGKEKDIHIAEIKASIFSTRGRLKEAMAIYKEIEHICRDSGDRQSLGISLGGQAFILREQSKLNEALSLMREEERIYREFGAKDMIQSNLGNQAVILTDQGKLDEAKVLLKEQESICRELGNKYELQKSLVNQGIILKLRERLEEAMALYKEAEHICRESGYKHFLQVSLGNQANIYEAWGRISEAMSLHKEKEKICRELNAPSDLAICLGNQAILLAWDLGKPAEALPLAKEAYELTIKHGLAAIFQDKKTIFDTIKKMV